MRRKNGVWTAVASLVLAGSLIGGGTAFAGTRSAKGQKLEDVVTAVDRKNQTITLGETTYRVTAKTRLLDAGDRRIRLRDLAAGAGGDMVEVELRRGKNGRPASIEQLRILEGDFE